MAINDIETAWFVKVNPTFSTMYPRKVRYIEKENGTKEMSFVSFAKTENELRNLERAKRDGILSETSKAKIRNAVNWLILFSDERTITIDNKKVKARCSFITLTLPSKQIHTDNEIKQQCLNQFLTELREQKSMLYYVWKAEKQKNGNLHFHIASDCLLHYSVVQKIWNRIINKLGYVDRYQATQKAKYVSGFKYDSSLFDKYQINAETQRKRYDKAKKEDFRNPHSTEIKAIHKIKNVAAYISEYIAKNPDNEDLRVTGNIYGMSQSLSTINITCDLQAYDFDLSKYKIVNKELITLILENFSTMYHSELHEPIHDYLESHVQRFGIN